MLHDQAVSRHYEHGSLLAAIAAAVDQMNKSTDGVTIDDLAAVDEFHIGGRGATEHLLAQLDFAAGDHILDVGCGLGGAARFAATQSGATVTGVDLTPEYVETGNALSEWIGLTERVVLYQGSALAMPFDDEQFDGGFTIHAAMNIEDKSALFREIARVLRPGALFGVYDIMRSQPGELAYPVPWATEPSLSLLATPDVYKQALTDAEFKVAAERNRRDFALEFFEQVQARTAANGGPPPLGLHTLMGESTGVKVTNMVENLKAGYIAPVEIIAQRV